VSDPEPLVYSVRQAAHVLATSTTTVRRLVEEGVLPIVPHMGQRIVIPRVAVANLVASGCSVALRGRTYRLRTEADSLHCRRWPIAGRHPHEEGYEAPSDDHAARILTAIVPPDSTRNRLPHAPDGVLSPKNHLLAGPQVRVERSGGGLPWSTA
jgi:excisionase family DNA binding protein